MLSLTSGTDICRRTLPLSNDRVLSPENISLIMRATTGMTWKMKREQMWQDHTLVKYSFNGCVCASF